MASSDTGVIADKDGSKFRIQTFPSMEYPGAGH